MGYAEASIFRKRIVVRTVQTKGVNDFDFMLAACKKVAGSSFNPAQKLWVYPLSVEACHELRAAFGDRLRVHEELASWYRIAKAEAVVHAALADGEDTELSARVPATFAAWLRGYQRVGAKWIAEGHRGSGLVADMPGLGKTPETLAALLEGDVHGPVLVVCPKASVKSVWGAEARQHLRGVPVYLCRGNREARTRMLQRFAQHMQKDPARLRIVVVVAEMLRVELGHPCYTKGGKKISSICPKVRKHGSCALHYNTPEELKYFLGVEQEEKKRKKELTPVGFQYPELFDEEMLRGGWSWLILDEAHRLLGSLTVVKANLMGRALKLLPERSQRRYALTGTPWGKGGRIEGMFGALHWLWPDEYTSFWKWARAVLQIEEKRIDRWGKTVPVIVGPKGMSANPSPEEETKAWEAFLESLGPRILRRTKEEMLKTLPPKTYVEVLCELSPAQHKQYKELADYAELSTANGPIMANGHLALHTRSQQVANGALTKGPNEKAQFTQDSGKLDQLWEKLDARGIIDNLPGDKLVVASRYNEFLDSVETMLRKDKVAMLRLDGSVGENQRNQIMTRWQENLGHERVMLVNTKAAGVSINLDAADEMHIMDEDPDPGVNEQLEDRIHRASRDHKVVIYYYRSEGTIDYLAAHDVEFRRRLQHAVLDGRRGLQYIRDMIKEALEA